MKMNYQEFLKYIKDSVEDCEHYKGSLEQASFEINDTDGSLDDGVVSEYIAFTIRYESKELKEEQEKNKLAERLLREAKEQIRKQVYGDSE